LTWGSNVPPTHSSEFFRLRCDILELLLGDTTGDPAPALLAHPRFTAALARFAVEPGRRIVYVVGNHDGRLAWDGAAARAVTAETGAELCLTADLRFETGAGVRTVRLEHGHRLDPSNAFADPRNPLDIPLGHHVVKEALPALEGAAWLSGVEHLADPSSIPSFIASRLAYRKMFRYLSWLAVPLLLALAIKIPLVVALAERARTPGSRPDAGAGPRPSSRGEPEPNSRLIASPATTGISTNNPRAMINVAIETC